MNIDTSSPLVAIPTFLVGLIIFVVAMRHIINDANSPRRPKAQRGMVATILKAMSNNAGITCIVTIMGGAALALVAVGLTTPEAYTFCRNLLLVEALMLGVIFILIDRFTPQQPRSVAQDFNEYFENFRNPNQPRRIRLALGFQWTVIRNGQTVTRQMQWAMA